MPPYCRKPAPVLYCKCRSQRSGFAIPLAVLAALSVGLFVVTLSTMNQGFRSNLQSLDVNQSMFNVAFSAYSDVLTRLRSKPWDERFFKNTVFKQNNVAFDKARYSLQVSDTPDRDYQVDLFIRVELQRNSKVYFWRFLFQDDILDACGRAYPLVFLEGDTASVTPDKIEDMVRDILRRRRINRPQAIEKSKIANTLSRPNDVADVVSALPGGARPLPEPIGGTEWPLAPDIPSIFKTPEERKKIAKNPPAQAPSVPEEYSGSVNFTGRGSGVRVASNSGTSNVSARCIDEKGTMIYVSVDGIVVLSWKSSQEKDYDELKEEWQKKKEKAEEKGKDGKDIPDTRGEWHDTIEKPFNVSFPVKPGSKIVTRYIGVKKSEHNHWFKMNGPF